MLNLEFYDSKIKEQKDLLSCEIELRFHIPFFVQGKEGEWENLLNFYENDSRFLDKKKENYINTYYSNIRIRKDDDENENNNEESGKEIEKITDFTDINNNYYYKFSISLERFTKKLTNLSKPTLFRHISRNSFFLSNYRIDISHVEERKHRDQEPIIFYEIEIEIRKEALKNYNISILENLFNEYKHLVKIFYNTRIFYNENERLNFINEYSKNLPGSVINYNEKNFILTDFYDKPIDLEIQDFSSMKFFNDDIYVTCKADGFRYILYIDENGIYLISPPKKKICFLYKGKIENDMLPVIFDGELIIESDRDILTQEKFIYYPFDIFMFTDKKQKIQTYNFNFSEKLNIIQRYDDIFFHFITIKLKLFILLPFGNIFDGMYKIFREKEKIDMKGNYSFKEDGLIFTPNIVPINKIGISLSQRKDVKITKKWKPTNKLTIDFKILKIKDEYKLGVTEYFNKKYTTKVFKYDDKEYTINPGNFKVNSIVECHFDLENYKFIIDRPRRDKAEPSSIKQAKSIMQLIFNPISENFLQGIGGGLPRMFNYHRSDRYRLLKIIKEYNNLNYTLYPYINDIKNILLATNTKKLEYKNETPSNIIINLIKFLLENIINDNKEIINILKNLFKNSIKNIKNLLENLIKNLLSINYICNDQPHVQNIINENIKFTRIFTNENFIVSNKIGTNLNDRKRHIILTLLEFISLIEENGLPIFVLSNEEIIIKEITEILKIDFPNIKIYNKKDFEEVNNSFHMISFYEDPEIENSYLNNNKTRNLINNFMIPFRLDIETDKFINFDGDIYYPIWSNKYPYIFVKGKSNWKLKLYNKENIIEGFNIFNNGIKKHLYPIKYQLNQYDNCYDCTAEQEIIKNLFKQKDYVKKIQEYFNYFTKITNKNLFTDTPNISNIIIDIGSGQGGAIPAWNEYNFNVIGIEPNAKNYQEFLKRSKNYNIIPIELGIYTKKDIDTMKEFMGNIKASVITSLNSITFFYESEDKIELFLDFVDTFIYKNGGFFVCIAVDGDKITEFINSNEFGTTKNFILYPTGKKNEIYVKIKKPGKNEYLVDQIEYLVNFPDLIRRLENRNYQIILDEFQDKEKLLNKEEKIYTNFSHIIIAKKIF